MQHTSTQAGPKISFSSEESASTYSTESSNYDGCLPLTINGVNIMKEDIREFYDLEGLWGENTLLNSSNQ